MFRDAPILSLSLMTHVGISFSVGIIDMMFQALSHKNYIRVFVFVVVTITGNGCQSKVL